MSILELKKTYNILLAREKKAELFLENNSILQAKRDKWLPEFVKITECLSILMRDYKRITGNEMKDAEILKGFE